MTLRQLFNLMCAVLLGFAVVWALAWAFGPSGDPEPLPTPGPAQEYCVTSDGNGLGFCPKKGY